MKKIALVFVALAVLTGCPNQRIEYEIPENLNGPQDAGDSQDLQDITQDSDDPQEGFEGPLIVRDGQKIPILAPVGFTEETILVRLTDSATPPTDWTLDDSIKNQLGNDVTRTVGFGQLQDDIGKPENKYAISLPKSLGPMWLHVTTGTKGENGAFNAGTLIDVFGNTYTVTSLTFTFFRRQPPNANFNVPQAIDVQSQGASASGQLTAVKQGSSLTLHPILSSGGRKNLRLKLCVEARVQKETGYERTLTCEVFCGAKSEDIPVPEFNQMY